MAHQRSQGQRRSPILRRALPRQHPFGPFRRARSPPTATLAPPHTISNLRSNCHFRKLQQLNSVGHLQGLASTLTVQLLRPPQKMRQIVRRKSFTPYPPSPASARACPPPPRAAPVPPLRVLAPQRDEAEGIHPAAGDAASAPDPCINPPL